MVVELNLLSKENKMLKGNKFDLLSKKVAE